MVVVIDYQAGNIGSILNMLRKIGAPAKISEKPEDILQAEKLILPGVGAYDYGMTKLREAGLLPALQQRAIEEKTPILGICLGAQLMCRRSEEGVLPGLGWIEADVRRFPPVVEDRRYPVPHMGWDVVNVVKPSRLTTQWPEESRFYFVHSYHIQCDHADDVLMENSYGVKFHSAFERDNIIGVQFHPEKSHKFGKRLLENFINLY